MTPPSAIDAVLLSSDADERPPLRPEEARALLRTCFVRFQGKLVDLARATLEMTGDLFEAQSSIPDGEAASFRLDPTLAAAAARTPDTQPATRGPEWVTFRPVELDGHAVDRARAWFSAAARRAAG